MVSSKHDRTLRRVFASPTVSDLSWREVESLFRALRADIEERAGSRIGIKLNGKRMVFHKPHPRPYLLKPAVRAVRRYLIEAGVRP